MRRVRPEQVAGSEGGNPLGGNPSGSDGWVSGSPGVECIGESGRHRFAGVRPGSDRTDEAEPPSGCLGHLISEDPSGSRTTLQ